MSRTPSISIHPAEPRHLPEVHRMLIALASHYGLVPTITPNALARLAFQGADARILVACLDDSPAPHPVGYVLIRTGQGRGPVGYVMDQLYVQEPFRRCGIGRALVFVARKLAQDASGTGLSMPVCPANENAAAVCRALGLTELPDPAQRFAAGL